MFNNLDNITKSSIKDFYSQFINYEKLEDNGNDFDYLFYSSDHNKNDALTFLQKNFEEIFEYNVFYRKDKDLLDFSSSIFFESPSLFLNHYINHNFGNKYVDYINKFNKDYLRIHKMLDQEWYNKFCNLIDLL